MIVFLFAQTLWGESFICVFYEGQAEYQFRGGWYPIDFGTSLGTNQIIRLGENSSVQLDSLQNSLFFSRPGEYHLTAIKEEIRTEQNSALDRLSDKINRLLKNRSDGTTVAMGIRGNVVGTDELGFANTSREELDRAWDQIASGDYSDAERELERLYQMSADPYSEGRLLFALAYAEEMQNKTGEAWNHLSDIFMPEQEEFYPSYLLLNGRISLRAQNYEEAVRSLETFLQNYPQNEATEEARVLLSLAKQGI